MNNSVKNSSKIVVADTKEAFIQSVEKALAQGYLPVEEYVVKNNHYIGKFTKDIDNTSLISVEAAMKALEQPMIVVNRQPVVRSSTKNTPAKTTRKRKV